MRKRNLVSMLLILIALTVAACGQPQPTLIKTSEGLRSIQSGGLPSFTPYEAEKPAALPIAKSVPQVDDPSDLALDGGLNWMWNTPIDSPVKLTAFDTMCVAAIGKGAGGMDCLYAGQVYEFGTPLYTAKEPYPRIGSVSGGKFSVYFIEYGRSGWRLMHLPLDSSPDQAIQVDAGEGMIPLLSPFGDYLTYAAQVGQEYQIRIWEKQPQQEMTPLKAAGTILLPEEPLEPDRAYAYYPEIGVTYTLKEDSGYAVVTARPGGEKSRVLLPERPLKAQMTPWGLYWVDTRGNLLCYDIQRQSLWQLGEDVRWYQSDALGIACLLADQGGTRVQYATLVGEDESAGMQAITLAQGSWTYLDGMLYSSGELYACALREWEGESQFAGIELALAREAD